MEESWSAGGVELLDWNRHWPTGALEGSRLRIAAIYREVESLCVVLAPPETGVRWTVACVPGQRLEFEAFAGLD